MKEQQLTLTSAPHNVQRGDVWQLAKHRLMCGNSTSLEDVARLFDGQKFDLCFTSPPYSNQRAYTIGSFDWHSLMVGTFDQIIAHGKPDCHILVNLGLSHKKRRVDLYWLDWLMHCASIGWPLFGWYVWDKLEGLPGNFNGRLAPAHEFLFHFNRENNKPNKWIPTKYTEQSKQREYKTALRTTHGTLDLVENTHSPDKFGQEYKIPDSVLRLHPQKARDEFTTKHPATFPVVLPEFIYRTWSHPDDCIYEPFCGSGTSLIAGTNLNRRVYAMEISEEYCQLAIERWQTLTCQQAVKVEGV